MQEIAYTGFGRNTLVTGLLSHFATLLVAMMTVSGADLFFSITFPFSCFALAVAAYVELKHRGCHPLSSLRFYIILAMTVIPLLGPLIILGLLYSLKKSGQETRTGLSGLFSALLRLKANLLVLFVLILFLFLLFAVIHSRHDPYFKRRTLSSMSPDLISDANKKVYKKIKSVEYITIAPKREMA
ncbi:MAG: hypothetical protein ABIK92_15395 [Pseudomonadota bacterium]